MQLNGCTRGYIVDDRVASDPESLRAEVFPKQYISTYKHLIPDESGSFDPPTDADVRERLAERVESQMAYARKNFPSIVGTITEPDLFAFGYVTEEQYAMISEISSYWTRVYEEREESERRLRDEQRGIVSRRLRFLDVHDASVTATMEGNDIIMVCQGGMTACDRIVLVNANIVQGELPDRFGGLYVEVWRIGDRYEIGFLAGVKGGLTEFTVMVDDARLYNHVGREITDDYDPRESFKRNLLGRCDKDMFWERDPENHRYVLKPKNVNVARRQ